MSVLPSDIYQSQIFPYLKEKNELQLNSVIKEEARNFSILALTCKKLRGLAYVHLIILNRKYEENARALQHYKMKPPTPRIIHLALVNADMQQFLIYLRNGADINEKNRAGKTVLQLCKRFKRDDFSKIITSHPYLNR